MLEESLSYPTRGENSTGRILILGGFLFFSFLLLPVFTLFGYVGRAMEASSRGDESPPELNDWAGLTVDGLKLTAIGFVYGLFPYVFMIVILGLMAATGEKIPELAIGFGFLGIAVVMTGSMLIQYLMPAAITHFMREGSMKSAFKIKEFKPVLFADSYVLAFALVMGISMMAYFAVFVISLFTLGIGVLLLLPVTPFIGAYFYLVAAYLFGTGYGKAIGDIEQSGD